MCHRTESQLREEIQLSEEDWSHFKKDWVDHLGWENLRICPICRHFIGIASTIEDEPEEEETDVIRLEIPIRKVT